MAFTSPWRALLALFAGLLLPLAFAPFSLSPLAVLAPATLFFLWLDDPPAHAVRHGFLFGLGMFGLGVSWVYVSLHDFGNMAAPLAGLAVFLFVAVLAAFPALVGWLQSLFIQRGKAVRLLLVMPALWALLEWVRSWFLTGFPWLSLGYSQIETPLAGLAPWLGVYGVSAATALSAGLVAGAVRGWKTRAWLYVPALVLLWAAAWGLGEVVWVQPVGAPVRTALVQGNIPLSLKWAPGARQAIVDRYLDLSERQLDRDLIVWPEAAVPGLLHQLKPDFWSRLARASQGQRTGFIFGVLEQDEASAAYYNSVVAVGAERGIYRKQHLVPFGEYQPFPVLTRWLMASLQIPMSNLSAWEGNQDVLEVAGQKVGVSICYEDAFPEEVRRFLPEATLLVNVSEDAWFGDSLGPHQRLQMARMRALETGRSMVRVANTGISAAIDHRGRVIARTEQFVTTVLNVAVQPMAGATPYVRFGNLGVLVLLAMMLGGAVFLTRGAPRDSASKERSDS